MLKSMSNPVDLGLGMEWFWQYVRELRRTELGQAQLGFGIAIALFVGLVTVLWIANKFRTSKAYRGNGQRVVLTGAASGIGRATVLGLWKLGYEVVACDINEKGLAELSEEVNTMGSFIGGYVGGKALGSVLTVVLDVASSESRAKLYEMLNGKPLHSLVSIAGIMQAQPQATLRESELERIIKVNALGPMQLINSLIPLLLKNQDCASHNRKGGTICIVSSTNARNAWPWTGAYPSSKHALAGYGDSLRREAMANKLPLRVSMIEPGAVLTPLSSGLIDRQVEWVKSNPESCWTPGIEKSALQAKKLMDKGLKLDWVSVKPETVANKIVNVLANDSPDARYVIATIDQHIIFRLAYHLPTWLGDRMMMALA